MPKWAQRKPTETGRPMTAGGGLIPDPDNNASTKTEKPNTTAVYLSPDHRHLAVVTRYEQLTIYRLTEEKPGKIIAEHRVRRLARVGWSSDGTLIAFVNHDHQAELLDVASGKSTLLGLASAVAFYPSSLEH
jgi:hypothetical protein